VPAGHLSDQIVSTLDVMPTFARLAGAEVPKDRVIDGVDQSNLLSGKCDRSARSTYYYYVKNTLHAVRENDWKLVLPDRPAGYSYVSDKTPIRRPQLYNLKADVSETRDLAAEHPQLVERLSDLIARAQRDIGDQGKPGKNARPFPGKADAGD
jgi:arylsulfatase